MAPGNLLPSHPEALAVGAVPASPPGRGPASNSFPGGGKSAVTIKKEEKLFAFFLGVNDLPNQHSLVSFKAAHVA